MGMPYSDPEKRREYNREWHREKRRLTRGNPQGPCGTKTEVQTAEQVLAILEEQIDALRRNRRLKTVDRAKAIAQLAGLCLKVIEARDIGAPLADVHSILQGRRLA